MNVVLPGLIRRRALKGAGGHGAGGNGAEQDGRANVARVMEGRMRLNSED